MPKPIGLGKLPIYVSFRTSSDRFRAMMKIGKARGLTSRTKSRVYRAAERLFIAKYGPMVELDDDLDWSEKEKRPFKFGLRKKASSSTG